MNSAWPKIKIGYITGGITVVLFAILYILRPNESVEFTPLSLTVAVFMVIAMAIGVIYWFMSVYRLHHILAEVTGGKYPVTPGKAIGYQFIPFFNVYWIFKWTGEVAAFVEHTEGRDVLGKNRQGWLLLGGGLVGRIFTGAFQLIAFAVLAHQCSAVKNALEGKTLPVEYAGERYDSPAGKIIAWVAAVFFFLVFAAIFIPNFAKAREEAQARAAAKPPATAKAPAAAPSQS